MHDLQVLARVHDFLVKKSIGAAQGIFHIFLGTKPFNFSIMRSCIHGRNIKKKNVQRTKAFVKR